MNGTANVKGKAYIINDNKPSCKIMKQAREHYWKKGVFKFQWVWNKPMSLLIITTSNYAPIGKSWGMWTNWFWAFFRWNSWFRPTTKPFVSFRESWGKILIYIGLKLCHKPYLFICISRRYKFFNLVISLKQFLADIINSVQYLV